ncbi:hypothetical protein NPIL_374601 [Nephila pilipes]|uniref:Uncharacterized protein n=1 Tax=Nephila pilipes TaxID=299642 RepID=A0A8X6TA72_NEPPI|nr:hypothetical protein NPIL_374601 [Nephila pilipes]
MENGTYFTGLLNSNGLSAWQDKKRSSRIMQMKRRNLVVFIPPSSKGLRHRQDEQPISVGKRRLVTKMHSLSTPPLFVWLQKVEVFVVLAWMGGLVDWGIHSVPSFKWILSVLKLVRALKEGWLRSWADPFYCKLFEIYCMLSGSVFDQR